MYDLVIIGAGPAGLSAAVYGIRGGMNLLVIESNAVSGGQVLTTYEVDNYLGLPGSDGFELGNTFKKHADKLGVTFKNAQVRSIEDLGDKKIVHTRKEDFEAKAVILATGADHAHLGVNGETEYAGMGVSYCATCDGAFYKGKDVAVVGGGDVALEDAIYLAKICNKVYLIHRRDEFRGAHVLQQELFEYKNVEVLYSHTVESVNGDNAVTGLTLKDLKSGENRELPVSGLFIAVGITPNTGLLKDLVSMDAGGYIIAGEDGQTEREGIFVAGDARKKKLRQIVTAVADGANAATSAIEYVTKKR